MTVSSRLTGLALRTARKMSGLDVLYLWDIELGESPVFVPDPTFRVTLDSADSGGTGVLQSSAIQAGPWSTVLALSDLTKGDQTELRGEAWFRLSGHATGTELNWNIQREVTDAVQGRLTWRTDEPGKKHVRASERLQNWIVEAAQVKEPDGTLHLPARGDRLTVDDETFRVLPESQDGPLWRWVDRQGQTHYRIFTRERS